MHRPRRKKRPLHRVTHRLPQIRQHPQIRRRHRQLRLPPWIIPENFHLIDRLSRRAFPHLRRPVRRQNQQRHPTLPRLDHRRIKIRRRRPRSANQHRRKPAPLRRPQREKRPRPLVQNRRRRDPRMFRQRDRQRCRTRSRTNHRFPHPRPKQGFREKAAPKTVDVGEVKILRHEEKPDPETPAIPPPDQDLSDPDSSLAPTNRAQT